MLGAEDSIGTSLDVTTRGQRDQDVDLGNQIFFRQRTRNVLNFRASLVAVLLFEVGHISANDVEMNQGPMSGVGLGFGDEMIIDPE